MNIFSESLNLLSPDFHFRDFPDAFAHAERGAGIRTMLGRLCFLHLDKKSFEACKRETDFIELQIDEALDHLQKQDRNEKTESHENERLRLVDEIAKGTQDQYTLRSQLISVFNPAHDGATVAHSKTFFRLARKPGA